ncbi:MinD/ParA family protein [Dechloromonas sp. ZY10]|uniref:MinD/ParA family ATP-binding protein n=1 Tax=Dechloromonas aquae TaxID=2664436 RepID=UPI00352973BC
MVNPASDQAAGLRRMMRGRGLQIVSFIAGCSGIGRSLAIANIGTALARQGKEVLIIDENAAHDDIASTFGLCAQQNLLHVIEHQQKLERVLLSPLPGLRLLPASEAITKLGQLTPRQQNAFIEAMASLSPPVDVILINSGICEPSGISPLGLAAIEHIAVVSPANAHSITEAYSLIKKTSQSFARKEFKILVTKVRNSDEATGVYNNLASVARAQGVARLEYAGHIPLDHSLREASRLRLSVFNCAPNSPAALSLKQIANDIQLRRIDFPPIESIRHFAQQLIHLSQRITTPHYS